MKFRITLKDPDGFADSIRDAACEMVEQIAGVDDDERQLMLESKNEKLSRLCEKWFSYSEYLTVETTDRGFRIVRLQLDSIPDHEARLISESSAVGPEPGAIDKPGSSFLWIGQDHHLSREEVLKLVVLLKGWAETGKLPMAAAGGG